MDEDHVMLHKQKRIALVAHDARKKDLLEWVQYNHDTLSKHFLFGTGSTGALIASQTGLPVRRFKSGPLGGDQQIGANIAEGEIDFLIFFWDPLEPQPHDPDVKALLRLAVLYNIPTASNRATADFLIASPFMSQSYKRYLPNYLHRLKEIVEEEEDGPPQEFLRSS
jgi:methylglyoxal synthase